MYGHFENFSIMLEFRWMLIDVLSLIFDIPNILFMYFMHLKNFRGENTDDESKTELVSKTEFSDSVIHPQTLKNASPALRSSHSSKIFFQRLGLLWSKI